MFWIPEYKEPKMKDVDFYLKKWKATPKRKTWLSRWMDRDATIVDFAIAYVLCFWIVAIAAIIVWVAR